MKEKKNTKRKLQQEQLENECFFFNSVLLQVLNLFRLQQKYILSDCFLVFDLILRGGAGPWTHRMKNKKKKKTGEKMNASNTNKQTIQQHIWK